MGKDQTEQAPAAVHAYAAAGITCCLRETGGPISRHDGYKGPRLRTTSNDSLVTCTDCQEWLRAAAGEE